MTNLQASRGDKVRFTPDRRKSGGEEESRMTEDFFCEERECFFVLKLQESSRGESTFVANPSGPHLLKLQRVVPVSRMEIHGANFCDFSDNLTSA